MLSDEKNEQVYLPYVRNDDGIPWDSILSIRLVLLSDSSGSLLECKVSRGHTTNVVIDLLRGTGGIHRMTSVINASTYGNDALSASVGRSPRPTTASISACALRWTSGKSVMARRNVVVVETSYTEVRTLSGRAGKGNLLCRTPHQ